MCNCVFVQVYVFLDPCVCVCMEHVCIYVGMFVLMQPLCMSVYVCAICVCSINSITFFDFIEWRGNMI